MNVEEVKKDLADQLMSLQLSVLKQTNRMEKEHREQLEILEEKHEKEMKRLVGQETELDRAVRNFEWERRRMVARNEEELEKVKRKNREEEERMRQENRELFRGNLEEDSRLNRALQGQEREMLNQNQRAYNSFQDQGSVREFQASLMRIDKKWKEIKDVFNSEVRYAIEKNDEDERKYVLVRGNSFMGDGWSAQDGIRKIKENRSEMAAQLMRISKDLGKLRGTVQEEDYEKIEKNLTAFQQEQSNLEAALDRVKRSVMRKQFPCWSEIDKIMTKCSESVNELLGNRISLRSEHILQLSDS